MAETITVAGRVFKVDGPPLTAELKAQVMQKLRSTVAQGCLSCGDQTGIRKMSPATCLDVTQGTTHPVTITASGGVSPYTYALLLDGAVKETSGSIAATTWTVNTTFTESVGSHTLAGRVVDSCGTPQTAIDTCSSFSITAPVTTGSIACTSTPTGTQVLLDGTNTGYTTPVTLTGVGAGSHTVTYRMTGYNDCSESVTVTAGLTTNSSCTLVLSCSALAAAITIV